MPLHNPLPFAFFLAVGISASSAVAGEIHYRAQPVAAAREARIIAGGLVWRCEADECVAGKSNSRPNVSCEALVRQVGALRSFAADGEMLAVDALEKCNSRAR